jgi:NADH dehydrogenase [ubiquinone] 1 alpha subcomplex assembly factor 6
MTEYAYCQNLVERFDPDRYLCSLFARSENRTDLMALYAFNVEVAGIRESVSEPLIGQMRLQWWRDNMDRIFEGAPPAHQVATALSQTINGWGLERTVFDELLDARVADFSDTPFATLAELESYAEKTSATLTRLALSVLGQSNPQVQDIGRHVGIAWALTGLLRAIPFHARQGRSYLPVGLVKGSAYKGPEISEVVAEVAFLASKHIQIARQGERNVPRAAVPALLTATLADGYLEELRNADFDPFKGDLRSRRVSTKFRILAKGLVGGF